MLTQEPPDGRDPAQTTFATHLANSGHLTTERLIVISSEMDCLVVRKITGSALILRMISEASRCVLAGHVRHILSDSSSGCVSSLLRDASTCADSQSPSILSALYLTWMNLLRTIASGTIPAARMLVMPDAHFELSMSWAPLQSLQSTSRIMASSSTKRCSQVLSLPREGTSFFDGLLLCVITQEDSGHGSCTVSSFVACM